MDINKVKRFPTASKVISIRIIEEDYNFMRENEIQPSKLIHEVLKEMISLKDKKVRVKK